MTKPIALHDGVFGGGRANRPNSAEGCQVREHFATPDHHFLDRRGILPAIEKKLADKPGKVEDYNSRLYNKNTDPFATAVFASGELIDVAAEQVTCTTRTTLPFEQTKAQVLIANNVELRIT